MNTKQVGDITEALFQYRCLCAGLTVCEPYGDCTEYDFVVDAPNLGFQRIQCKTGWVRRGVLVFACFGMTTVDGQQVRKLYRGKADWFAVRNPDTDVLYLVPVESVGSSEVRLRLTPTANSQKKRVRLASDYLFEKSEIVNGAMV